MACLGPGLLARRGAGGTVGLALLAQYALSLPFAPLLIAINTPFYIMAWWRMGWRFTLKTVAAVLLLTLYTSLLPRWMGLSDLDPLSGAVLGGLLLGAGFLILFRHRASLGGLNVLVLWLQERYGWSAGWMQLALDAAILMCALPWLSVYQMLLSVVTALAMNLTLALNHKPGRYIGV